MTLNIIVSFIFASVTGIDYSYTKVGYVDIAGTKTHCINDCRDNLCIIGDTLKKYRCTSGTMPAPISFTYSDYNLRCLGRCDFIGTSYAWCYVSQSGSWEYCNGNYVSLWIRDRPFTRSDGPCMSDCVLSYCNGADCKYRCESFWGSSDDCFPNEGYDYVQSYVPNGGECRGRCDYHDGYSYQWCYYGSNRKWDRCAQPTIPNRVPWVQRLSDLPLSNVVQRVKPELTLDNRTISKVISDILFDHTLMIVNLHYQTNPVYKYAHEQQRKGKSPVLVRAKVRQQHLRDIGERCGLLISAGLGGPRQAYNTIPYHGPVATAHFDSEESAVREFLTRHTGEDAYVKIDVVAIYNTGITRQTTSVPVGFVVHTKYYQNDQLMQEYSDIVPNI